MRRLWSLPGTARLPETSRFTLRVLGLLYFVESSPVGVLFPFVTLIASWLPARREPAVVAGTGAA